eukprot:TRINITY_DN139_c4_g1_i1.p1 TRINITY_DN139_c4_g1~~TRINITY_DN139_c4_g1_i1.p1  ORF type:complete len:726 (+),score=250.22 TRINITY_DN139_c4_g1_i1:68-2179(+)
MFTKKTELSKVLFVGAANSKIQQLVYSYNSTFYEGDLINLNAETQVKDFYSVPFTILCHEWGEPNVPTFYQGIVLVFNLQDRATYTQIRTIKEALLKPGNNTPFLLVGNNSHFGTSNRQVTIQQIKSLAHELSCEYLEASAITKHNLRAIIEKFIPEPLVDYRRKTLFNFITEPAQFNNEFKVEIESRLPIPFYNTIPIQDDYSTRTIAILGIRCNTSAKNLLISIFKPFQLILIKSLRFFAENELKAALIEFFRVDDAQKTYHILLRENKSGYRLHFSRITIANSIEMDFNLISKSFGIKSDVKESDFDIALNANADIINTKANASTSTTTTTTTTTTTATATPPTASAAEVYAQQMQRLREENNLLKNNNDKLMSQLHFVRRRYENLDKINQKIIIEKQQIENLFSMLLDGYPKNTELPEDIIQYCFQEKREIEKKANQRLARINFIVTRYASNWLKYTKRKNEERVSAALIQQIMEEERKEREKELETKTYICPICEGDYPIEEFYLLDECNHRICLECLGQYLKTKIVEGEVKEIKCPLTNCKMQIKASEIKHCVDEKVFKKFDEFALKNALEGMTDLRWCPKPECENAMIGDKSNPMMVCSNPECKFCFCFNCKEDWHADVTCEQYQEWKKENSQADVRSWQWMKDHTRPCPKCHAQIEKNGGCNHMTCKKCKHEFCWLCNSTYSTSHFSTTSCKQFT